MTQRVSVMWPRVDPANHGRWHSRQFHAFAGNRIWWKPWRRRVTVKAYLYVGPQATKENR